MLLLMMLISNDVALCARIEYTLLIIIKKKQKYYSKLISFHSLSRLQTEIDQTEIFKQFKECNYIYLPWKLR